MGKLSKGRGYRWEVETAKTLSGHRTNAGPGWDVEVLELGSVEAKAQQDDSGLKTLTGWIDQARKYAVETGGWALSVKLGLGRGAYKLLVMDLKDFCKLLNELRELREWKKAHECSVSRRADQRAEPEGGERLAG